MTAVFASQGALPASLSSLRPNVHTGWGQLSAGLVALVVVSAYKSSMLADAVGQPNSVDYCWRLLIGLGCVPGACALYFRCAVSYDCPPPPEPLPVLPFLVRRAASRSDVSDHLAETPRFTMDVERNVKQASTDIDAYMSAGTFVHDVRTAATLDTEFDPWRSTSTLTSRSRRPRRRAATS